MSEEAIEQEARTDVVPQKEELEREKLLLEIQKLKDPWWKNPAYILAALPTMLAVLTLIYGFANGYFQATATKLANERHDLAAEVKHPRRKRRGIRSVYSNRSSWASGAPL